jgi:integrase/recombinase XerD
MLAAQPHEAATFCLTSFARQSVNDTLTVASWTEGGQRMTVQFARHKAARETGDTGTAAPRAESRGHLNWEAALALFTECWAADHPGIRPGTLGHYREQLRSRLAVFAEQRGVETVGMLSRYDFRAFVSWLDSVVTYAGHPLTPRGKQMALETARRFLVWLHQERVLPEDVTAHVGKYRLDRDLEPRAIPAEDLQRLLAALDLGTPAGVRNAAMTQVMAFCGLRVAELVGLNADDLSLDEGRIRVRAETSKGRRTRFVDLPLTIVEGREAVRPEVAGLMASWRAVRSELCPRLSEEDAFFVTVGSDQQLRRFRETGEAKPGTWPPGQRVTTDAVRTILKRLAGKAGVDPKLATPHRLRHYFGLSSALAGVPTTALMRAMGHRSPIMTARYSEFADSERRWAFARADITKGLSLPTAR